MTFHNSFSQTTLESSTTETIMESNLSYFTITESHLSYLNPL